MQRLANDHRFNQKIKHIEATLNRLILYHFSLQFHCVIYRKETTSDEKLRKHNPETV